MISIKKIVAGYMRTNNYIVSSDIDNQAIIIDAGGSLDKINSYLKENNLTLKALLLTHGHFDHIMIARKLKEEYNLKIYIHKNDEEMLKSDKNMGNQLGLTVPYCDADVLLMGGETITYGEMNFEVIHTPGHSKGSVCYKLNNECIFCGDTLFLNSYGATQFYGGSIADLQSSAKKLFAIEGDMPLYCGHNEETTLDYERLHNPIKLCIKLD